MKKNMLLLACLVTTCAHAMETNSWNLISHENKINMIKGSLLDTDTDLIVVGTNQQKTLQGILYEHSIADTGRIDYPENNVVYIRKNNSDDDSSKLFPNYDKKQLWTHKKEMLSKVWSITEPTLIGEQYITTETSPWDKHIGTKEYSIGNKTLAAIFLSTCYYKILTEGLEELKDKKEKKIAFPLLGAAVGFSTDDAALAAVSGIICFSKEYPHAYSLIELFIEKESEVNSFLKRFNEIQSTLEKESEVNTII